MYHRPPFHSVLNDCVSRVESLQRLQAASELFASLQPSQPVASQPQQQQQQQTSNEKSNGNGNGQAARAFPRFATTPFVSSLLIDATVDASLNSARPYDPIRASLLSASEMARQKNVSAGKYDLCKLSGKGFAQLMANLTFTPAVSAEPMSAAVAAPIQSTTAASNSYMPPAPAPAPLSAAPYAPTSTTPTPSPPTFAQSSSIPAAATSSASNFIRPNPTNATFNRPPPAAAINPPSNASASSAPTFPPPNGGWFAAPAPGSVSSTTAANNSTGTGAGAANPMFDRARDMRDRDASLRGAEVSGFAPKRPLLNASSAASLSAAASSLDEGRSRWDRSNMYEDGSEGEARVHPSKKARYGASNVIDDDDDAVAAPAANPFMTGNAKLAEDLAKKYGSKAQAEATIKRQREEAAAAAASSSTASKSLGGKRKFTPPYKTNPKPEEESSSGPLNPMIRTALAGPNAKEGDPVHEKLKHLDAKLVENILGEMMESPGVKWSDIAGLEFAKKSVREIVVWPILRPDMFTGLRGPPKGLLLFGPPGTGKTLIGKAIASESKSRFFSISASSLTSKWHGEGEKLVRTLFAVAQVYEPSIIFIDEIDSLLSQRTESEFEASRRIKTEFLIQLDGANTTGKERVLVVGATNRPQELDEAARRRLVKKLYVPLPDSASRMQLLRTTMSRAGVDHRLTDADFEAIMRQAEGYSGSDMAALCTEASMGPIRTMSSMMDTDDITSIDSATVRPIERSDFDAAFKSIRPSVNQKDLAQYVAWNQQYGSFPMSADGTPLPPSNAP